MSKLIVVVGATGTQGASVAKSFLQSPGWRVRGITRNPSSSAAKSLADQGVEMMQADLDNSESLRTAFNGATVIYCNTDFFQHLFPAIASGNEEPLQHAYRREVEQGVNAAKAAASPETMQTLKVYILSALPDLRKLSKGKYTNFYHFDSKVDTVRVINERYPELARKMSLLHLGHYVENWKTAPFLRPQKQADGSYVFRRTFAPEFEVEWVVASKDTGAHVKALVDLPPGQNVLAVSERMTMSDWAEVWGKVQGVSATYQRVSDDELFDGVPEAMKNELADDFNFMQEAGFTGGDPGIKTLEQLGIDVPLTSMRKYFEQEA